MYRDCPFDVIGQWDASWSLLKRHWPIFIASANVLVSFRARCSCLFSSSTIVTCFADSARSALARYNNVCIFCIFSRLLWSWRIFASRLSFIALSVLWSWRIFALRSSFFALSVSAAIFPFFTCFVEITWKFLESWMLTFPIVLLDFATTLGFCYFGDVIGNSLAW